MNPSMLAIDRGGNVPVDTKSGHVPVETRRSCKNCDGVGSCAAGRGNRFVCTLCNGQGEVVVSSEIMPKQAAEVELASAEAGQAGDTKNEDNCGATASGGGIQWQGGEGLSVNITLSIQCLLNTGGIFLGLVGFIFLLATKNTVVVVFGVLLLLVGIALVVKANFAMCREQYRRRQARNVEEKTDATSGSSNHEEGHPVENNL
jgi:hypothetical protein